MDTGKGWRTLGVSVLFAVLGVVQAFDWATVIPQGQTWSGAALIVAGAVMAGLRYVTTTPLGKSK